ncbi:beta-ketoacyl-[acyl-carrier-protein] synthase family protein [Actinokineospora sp. PR83]|uniref:beta-ketoacyl-[acyl-carrier-protein] synthase family protein n=1 Tax=Actinokineospora sp. PR83 TaxID=2884908 RepID=UPI0027E05F3D|nr:beta-ketoacyl-[acyl-carrier-protein] synthase family protein [Actinokineospora sp. PR83]MCG8914799.1 beta-ketoacyl-[acyl-carrier-protein] synthase family protein [Actinokineospora sp. PR83]
MSRRVVITGLGPVSSIGTGVGAFGEGLRTGRSGISPITAFDTTGFPHTMAGEVSDFDPKALLERISPQDWGRTSLFAAAAARLAVRDAGIDPTELSRAAAGSCMGTTGGESQVLEQLTEDSLTTGFGGVDRARVAHVPGSRLAVAVNRELGLSGEALTLSTACSASNYAVGHAYDQIHTGEADYVVAGGADSVERWSHAGFYRLGAVAERYCRPFDRDRTGILVGEGGAALFLESLDSALARGARIYAEVLGYGLNCDAHHMTAPNKDSIVACIKQAHRNAGIDAAEVDYICAHGTGTPANDLAEATAVHEAFDGAPPPISSVKSMLGHTMGAASGFSAIASVLGIHESFLPPTTNFETLDPALPAIDPVPNEARYQPVRVAQVNGFAFGGNNAITIFGRYS